LFCKKYNFEIKNSKELEIINLRSFNINIDINLKVNKIKRKKSFFLDKNENFYMYK
jgi:hypothetical protein